MNKREIVEDYKSYIITQNKSICPNTIHIEYLAIDGDNVRVSTVPYILDNAPISVVIYHYQYIVQTQRSSNFFALFMTETGRVEDYIEINGWHFRFNTPITAHFHTDSKYAIISKGNLELKVKIPLAYISSSMDKLWALFKEARNCTTILELEYLKKLFEANKQIEELDGRNFKQESQIDLLNEKIKAYEGLLDKIEKMVYSQRTD